MYSYAAPEKVYIRYNRDQAGSFNSSIFSFLPLFLPLLSIMHTYSAMNSSSTKLDFLINFLFMNNQT